jgi:HK97 family phage portal protein
VVEVLQDSGLIAVQEWHKRAIPRDNLPNSNPPFGSVGPNVDEGFGDVHVAYSASNPPMNVQAWQGWPVSWDTPNWNGQTFPQGASTLWTCIDLNTRQLASFPVFGVRGVNVFALPEWSNNPEPELYSDWTEAAKQLFNSYQSYGEVFLWCTGRYANGQVARWVVLNPDFMNVELVDGSIQYSLAGAVLERDDVCHIKYQSRATNLRGISPLEWCAQSIMGSIALERMINDLATRGGIPWGVLKHPRKLNDREATELRNRWAEAASDRRGTPAILSGGIELEALTISPRDMALLELRVFDETRIASALGVPPYLVGLPMPEGLTYSNAISLFEFHWRGTLRPMAHAVASAMSAWLLPRGQRMEFNRDEYVRPSAYERAQTYQILFNMIDEKGNRAITTDEIRMAERWLPNEPVTADDINQVGALP